MKKILIRIVLLLCISNLYFSEFINIFKQGDNLSDHVKFPTSDIVKKAITKTSLCTKSCSNFASSAISTQILWNNYKKRTATFVVIEQLPPDQQTSPPLFFLIFAFCGIEFLPRLSTRTAKVAAEVQSFTKKRGTCGSRQFVNQDCYRPTT